MVKIKKLVIRNCTLVIVLLMLVMPVISFAYKLGDPLVPCNNTLNPCNFDAFMTLINNVIHFLLFYMAVPIAAIMFFYAGFLMVTSGGSSESKTRAKSIFSNAVIGLVLAAGAWLIVKTILSRGLDWVLDVCMGRKFFAKNFLPLYNRTMNFIKINLIASLILLLMVASPIISLAADTISGEPCDAVVPGKINNPICAKTIQELKNRDFC